MRIFVVILVLSLLLVEAFAVSQAPFVSADEEQAAHDATDNLIFTSIASLLQQWPNTRWRNGHTIIQGSIPVGTILYHGRRDKNLPVTPEWAATNVEHSALLCGPPECWMLTLAVQERLKIIYFDGSSASNSVMGHQDAQDLVIYGKVRPDKTMAEFERIRLLCDWATPFGVDAIVRMEPGFEVMLCDFSKKVKLVSALHIMTEESRVGLELLLERKQVRDAGEYLKTNTSKPDRPRGPRLPQPIPGHWHGPLRSSTSTGLEAVLAAGWNNFYPGEARVQLDYTRFVSFYDPRFSSLIKSREGVSRDGHRLTDISREDYQKAMAQLQSDLTKFTVVTSSGIDWSTIIRTVMDRYGERLRLMRAALFVDAYSECNATELALQTRQRLMVMLMPYTVFGVLPDTDDYEEASRNTSWVAPIRKHCETSLLAGVEDVPLTRSERLLKRATQGVLSRICATLTTIWVDALFVTVVPEWQAAQLMKSWLKQVDGLMESLAWPIWDTCHPACPEHMFCYIATWPWGVPWGASDPGAIDMTPRCVDRVNGKLGDPTPPH